MLTFVVVASRNGARIPDRVLDRLRDRACADVPFDARTHLVWLNERGTVAFGGWQDAPDETSAAHHWHVDEDRLTAFSGHLWPRRNGWRGTRPWAEQLAQHLRSAPLTAGGDDLAGIHVAASLHRRGRCSIAADPFGIRLLYWGEGRDLVAISSRAALAAALVTSEDATTPKRDVMGVGWLAYVGVPLGLETGFEAVSVVPQGSLIDIDPAGDARVIHASRPPWRLESGAMSPDSLLAEARSEMTTNIRMARVMAERSCADLTGGKDSRLIAALLLEDGSAADVEFRTSGEADLPDVLVARQIAESFGLRHVVNRDLAEAWAWRLALTAAVRDNGHADTSSREIALRVATWTCSGTRIVSQPRLGQLPSYDRVVLSGLWGETLRTNYPGTTYYRSKEQVAHFPSDHGFGSAGILKQDALAHYGREVHRVLFDSCLATDSPQDVVDAYYVRSRYRRWFGTALEIDSDNRAFPLLSITAVRLAFAIGTENRHAEWIHHQLMSRACEPLLHIPFAHGSWHRDAGQALVSPRAYNDRIPTDPPAITKPAARHRAPTVRTVNRDLRSKDEELDLDIMRRFLRDDPSNPLFDIVDPIATQAALDRFATLP
ncbi:MAG: hypothetical protein QOG30_1735, partial [Acidimicrobiaceae bacterium]